MPLYSVENSLMPVSQLILLPLYVSVDCSRIIVEQESNPCQLLIHAASPSVERTLGHVPVAINLW